LIFSCNNRFVPNFVFHNSIFRGQDRIRTCFAIKGLMTVISNLHCCSMD
jgi:hypothetical protein